MTYSGFDLSGNVAFVTGASRGIGRAIALGLAECGADLFLCSRTLPDLQAVAREVRTRGPKAEVTAVDVGSVESIQAGVGAAIYLASPASDLVTGHLLMVDGGWTAQ